MDHATPLVRFPYVVMRIKCYICRRHGAYRLARVAAKYGPETSIGEVLVRLSADCPARGDTRNHGFINCGARLVDLEPPQPPPDLPPGAAALRVVRGGKR